VLKAFLTPQREHTRSEVLEAYLLVWWGVMNGGPTLSSNSLPPELARKLPAMARRDLRVALKWSKKLSIKLQTASLKGAKKRQSQKRAIENLRKTLELIATTSSGKLEDGSVIAPCSFASLLL
jgi:3-polyprenyl-4-hydroxybenzoate decarboxylase